MEGVDDELGLIDGGAKVTASQSFLLRQVAEGLGEEQGVDGGVEEGEKVVVAGHGLAVLTPCSGAVEVGTDGEHHGCLRYHRLVEMGGGELRLAFGRACDDDTVQLQVAHGLRA